MRMNRRNFIQLLVGGVAGLHVTPLPWKLTDDIAIWTQNWPWVPVPPEGRFSHVKSVCTLCGGGCGIEVRKVGDRAVKIEGRTDYPVNPGGICPVGMGALQLLYNHDIRFTGPMKRVGPRGAGQFIEISWEEAIGILAGRISGLRKERRSEALAAVDGNPESSSTAVLIARLMEAVGSPNYLRPPSLDDTYRMTNLLMQGNTGPMAYDLENADFLLSFGAGLLEGWGAPGRVLNAWNMWHAEPLKEKVKIVQIESRASNTASKADQWVAPKPGTEAALALGLAHVIIKEGLYDRDFTENYAFGFNDCPGPDGRMHTGFKNLVLNEYAPSRVAAVTGVPADQIATLAGDFATAKAPVALYGKGKGTLNGSVYECMSIQALNALLGRINQPGGVLVQDGLPLASLPPLVHDPTALGGLRSRRLDRAGEKIYPFSHTVMEEFSKNVLEQGGVDTILISSSNPAYTLPDAEAFRDALVKIPFVVSFSPFRDETAAMADLVLPDHTALEKMDDVVWPMGLQYPLYGLAGPAVAPVYSTRNTGDVLLELARRIGGKVAEGFPWKDFEGVLKERAKGLYDSGPGLVRFDEAIPPWEMMTSRESRAADYTSFEDMWKKLKEGGLWYRPAAQYRTWGEIFKTRTGRFEFYSLEIHRALQRVKDPSRLGVAGSGDEACLPHFAEGNGKAERRGYPLQLVPYEIINLSSGWLPTPPHLTKTYDVHLLTRSDSFVEINPKTAGHLGVSAGDRVLLESPAGKAKVRVNLFEGAMPGMIYMPMGLGHTAYDEFLRERGADCNAVVEPWKDPLSGHPVWWDTPVKLTKL